MKIVSAFTKLGAANHSAVCRSVIFYINLGLGIVVAVTKSTRTHEKIIVIHFVRRLSRRLKGSFYMNWRKTWGFEKEFLMAKD